MSELLFYAVLEADAAVVDRTKAVARSSGRVIEHDHLALFCVGEAKVIALPHGISDERANQAVGSELEEILPIDQASSSSSVVPLALGALPFDPEAATSLTVPTITVIARDKQAVVILVGTHEQLVGAESLFPFIDCTEVVEEPEAPDSFSLGSVRSHADFRDRIKDAVAAIQSGELDKVVLAREVIVRANRPFSQRRLVERMRVLHPSCAAFAIDGFVGASPELLCRRNAHTASAQPLAGTIARSGDPEDDLRLGEMLLSSEKERSEHAFVVDEIVRNFRSLGAGHVAIDGPRLLELRNVAHLETFVSAELAPDALGAVPSALEVLAALHPTPAVGGMPRNEALAYIEKHEGFDRGRYAGAVGFVDANGDGEWWIGIRCAVVSGNEARLFAGVGIVAHSDPESELIETQLKLQALLATAVRP